MVAMKTAITLLVLGLVVEFAIPHYLRDIYGGAGLQLPRFWFSKAPPLNFSLNLPVILRVIGIILVLLAISRVILVRGSRA